MVGKFAQYSLSVWLYSLNLATLAAANYLLVVLLPDIADDQHTLDRKVSAALLITTAALCAGLSLINPQKALWAYVLNAAATPLTRWLGAKRRPQAS